MDFPHLSVTVTTTSVAAVITVPIARLCEITKSSASVQLSEAFARISAVKSGIENLQAVWSILAAFVVIASAAIVGLVTSLIV